MKSVLILALSCAPIVTAYHQQSDKELNNREQTTFLLFLHELIELAEPEDTELIEKIKSAASQKDIAISLEALEAASFILEKRSDKINSSEKARSLLTNLLAWIGELLGLELDNALESIQAINQDEYCEEDY